MSKTLAVLATIMAFAAPALADAPPSHLDVTPLVQADVDFYLAIKRAGADCVNHASGADREALDIMRKNHGVLKMPAMPDIKGNPTPQQLAYLQKNMAAISAQASRNSAIETRAAALSSCDEAIAQKRGVKPRYDALRGVIESAVPMNEGAVGSCGGDCGAANPTAAQRALWKREEDVMNADRTLLKPHADEIRKLQKTLMSAMGI
ncbi:MAG TPA: hypothetical protein VJ476_01425 [Rhizomicrobium sp.]|nr:hypothetical protein [Rhizomicrobium sp.]